MDGFPKQKIQLMFVDQDKHFGYATDA